MFEWRFWFSRHGNSSCRIAYHYAQNAQCSNVDTIVDRRCNKQKTKTSFFLLRTQWNLEMNPDLIASNEVQALIRGNNHAHSVWAEHIRKLKSSNIDIIDQNRLNAVTYREKQNHSMWMHMHCSIQCICNSQSHNHTITVRQHALGMVLPATAYVCRFNFCFSFFVLFSVTNGRCASQRTRATIAIEF